MKRSYYLKWKKGYVDPKILFYIFFDWTQWGCKRDLSMSWHPLMEITLKCVTNPPSNVLSVSTSCYAVSYWSDLFIYLVIVLCHNKVRVKKGQPWLATFVYSSCCVRNSPLTSFPQHMHLHMAKKKKRTI